MVVSCPTCSSGDTYHYADWYKSSSATALVLVYKENGLTVYRTIDKNIPASLDGRHYSISFDIPDNQGPSDTIPVSVMHLFTSTGSLNIDDVVFHQEVDSFVRPLISITFDDGFRGQFTHGLPLLCKYHIPATFFLTSDYVLKGYADYMQPSMVGTLIKDGMEIGDHTVDHHSLVLLSPSKLTGKSINQKLTWSSSSKSTSQTLLLLMGMSMILFLHKSGEYPKLTEVLMSV